VIADSGRRQDNGTLGQLVQQVIDVRFRGLLTQGQDPAMQGKAGNTVQDRLRRGIDRNA
jgi:hypothetical protein